MEKTAFDIWLVWSDRRLHVGEDTTALAVLQDAGIAIDVGCTHGECGTCATEYVEGDVIHNDSCLSAADREHEFCPCISRARGTLVLPF